MNNAKQVMLSTMKTFKTIALWILLLVLVLVTIRAVRYIFDPGPCLPNGFCLRSGD